MKEKGTSEKLFIHAFREVRAYILRNHLEPGDLLYMYDEDGEYLVIWTSDNGEDEMLSIELDEELYQELAKNYLQYMEVPATHYAEVDQYWIRQRFERGEE